MELIERARELGIALAESNEFIRMREAQNAVADSESVSGLITELTEKRARLVGLFEQEEQSGSDALSLTNDIERLQGQLSENPLFSELLESESAFSALITAIDDEINACIGQQKSGCDGDCGSCGGCRH